MCGALSCGQYRMDRAQDLVMEERLGDKGGDEAGAQGLPLDIHSVRMA